MDVSQRYGISVFKELIMAFEDEYGITADYEEMDKRVKTVGDIIEYLKDQGADI